MKKFLYSIHHPILLLLCLAIVSCSDSNRSNTDLTDTDAYENGESGADNIAKVKEIFHAVPSPMEMASMLKQVGAQYNPRILNDVKNVSNYTSARSQALNLGIYGADLSYASVFNQNQESIIYLSCVKKLADNLGVTKAFNDETIERIEANVDNRDSLLNIISETFYVLDAYLKENDRQHISAMVIAAGWVEGLHISTAIATSAETPGDILLNRIGEQKLSLANLMDLVRAYNKEGQLSDILADLEAIKNSFEGVTIEHGKSGVSKDSEGRTVIGAGTTVNISDMNLKKIRETVTEIRQRYIS